jgi:hypothetical protein
MDDKNLSIIDVFRIYLEYLNRWNKSYSLLSILETLKNEPSYFDGKQDELIFICRIEYEDTIDAFYEEAKRQGILNPKPRIMSVDEMISKLITHIRNEKIDQII